MITKLNIKTKDDTDEVFHVRKGQVFKVAYDSVSKKKEKDNVISVDKKNANALRQGNEIVINNTKVVIKVFGFDRCKMRTISWKHPAIDRIFLKKYIGEIRNILKIFKKFFSLLFIFIKLKSFNDLNLNSLITRKYLFREYRSRITIYD
jgi:hypothetical protein